MKYKDDILIYFRTGVKTGYGAGMSCGYINKNSDTIYPMHKFESCYTDTFITYSFVYDKKLDSNNSVAINRKGQIIFDAYLFDNWPEDSNSDICKEGLFRIRKNGKIGFANKFGQIVIEPKFECAYPFANGKAKVAYNCETIMDDLDCNSSWESENWFYIDKKGNKIKRRH